MSRSLLNRLPDILARAAVRSSEAMHALGLRPGASTLAWSTRQADDEGALALPDDGATRLQTGHDLALLLNSFIHNPQHPSLRGQVGFLWLRAEPSQPLAQATASPAGTPPTPDIALRQACLSDLALRLFVARELLAPSALVAVTPAPDLGTCIPLMLKTVFGNDPFRVATGAHGAGPTVLACRPASTPGARPALASRLHSPSLAQCLHETPAMGRTAVVMRPGADILDLQAAWSGDWLLTDPEPDAIRTLRGQWSQRAWARPSRFTSRIAREPGTAWG